MSRSELVPINIVPPEGELPFSIRVGLRDQDRFISTLHCNRRGDISVHLPPSHLKVLQLGILCESVDEIAALLGVTYSTARTYRNEISSSLSPFAQHVKLWSRWLSGFAVVHELMSTDIHEVVKSATSQLPELTDIQYKTSCLLASGYTNGEIAEFRDVNVRTVKDCVSLLYTKSGLHGELYTAAFVNQCLHDGGNHEFLNQYLI